MLVRPTAARPVACNFEENAGMPTLRIVRVSLDKEGGA